MQKLSEFPPIDFLRVYAFAGGGGKDHLDGQLTRMEGGLKEQMDVLIFLILAGLHCSGKALSKS